MTSSESPRRPPARETFMHALLLIFIQIAGGTVYLPQTAFFVIFLEEQLHLAPVAISSVVSGAQVAGMISALLGGAISARLGSKWVLVTGLVFSAIGGLAFQSRVLWLAALLWFAGGAGLALASVGSASILTRLSAGGSLGLLAAFYALSTTIGGAIGNPLAGVLIEQSGYTAFSWAVVVVASVNILVVVLLMAPAQGQAAAPPSLRALAAGMVAIARRPNVRRIIGLRTLPTIFYGVLMVLVPLLLNNLTGDKVLVAAYGTTNLVVASAAQLVAGRSADRWGARVPTLVGYSAMILAGLGLALTAGQVWGLFAFGVLGIASAWALATLMYVWVNDGVAKAEHPATFGLLHAVWSMSMITGSVLAGWFAARLPGLPFLIAGLLNVGSLFLISAYYSAGRRSELDAGRG